MAVAQTLLQLLDSLLESVVPPSLQARCAQITSRDEAFEVCSLFFSHARSLHYLKLLDELPSVSVNVSSISFIRWSPWFPNVHIGMDIYHRISSLYCATFVRGRSNKHQQCPQTWYDVSFSILHTSSNILKSYCVWTRPTSRRDNNFPGYLPHRKTQLPPALYCLILRLYLLYTIFICMKG